LTIKGSITGEISAVYFADKSYKYYYIIVAKDIFNYLHTTNNTYYTIAQHMQICHRQCEKQGSGRKKRKINHRWLN
jgi:hypothetical protein